MTSVNNIKMSLWLCKNFRKLKILPHRQSLLLSRKCWSLPLLWHSSDSRNCHSYQQSYRENVCVPNRVCLSNHHSYLLSSLSKNTCLLSMNFHGVKFASVKSFSTSTKRPEGSSLVDTTLTGTLVDTTSTGTLLFPDFPTIYGAEKMIHGIHECTGFPWWMSIILSAFLLRILLPLPLSIYSMHNAVRLRRLQPEIKGTAKQLRKEVSMAMHQFGWDEKKARAEFIKNMKRHLRNLYIRDNCHPMKETASFWLRFPLWVSASYALRNMTVRSGDPMLTDHQCCESLTTGGVGWFLDLTVVDSTWTLPILMGLVTLLNVEIGQRSVTEMTPYRKGLTFALRGLSLAFIPISAFLPSGLILYWVSSGAFSALQTTLVDKSRTFRTLIGINPLPDTENDAKDSKSDSLKR